MVNLVKSNIYPATMLYPSEVKEPYSTSPSFNSQDVPKIQNDRKEEREILLRILSVADRTIHTIDNPKLSLDNQQNIPPEKIQYFSSRRTQAFRKTTNFDDIEIPNNYRSLHIVRNTLSTLGMIFFGIKLPHANQDPRSDEKMMMDTLADNDKWLLLKSKYSDELQSKIYDIFYEAVILINTRQSNVQEAFNKRFIFYSSIISSIFAKAMNYKFITYFVMSSAAISFIFMLKQYLTNYMILSQLEFKLKSEVEEVYKSLTT